MILPQTLSYALAAMPYLKYPLIFLATPLGGPTLILASGFLLRLGLLDALPLFIAIGLGELALDVLWYWLGYRYADRLIERYGRFFSFSPDTFEKIKQLFARYRMGILFLSKVLMGFGMIIAILMTAGATRMPFKKYLLVTALGEAVWLSVMLTLGYFLGELYTRVADELRVAFLIITPCLVLASFYGISRYARGKLLR